MTIREQIITALRLYKTGSYDVRTFCDVFGSLYFYQSSGYKFFEGIERELFDEIGFVAERCTDSEDDLAQYPNTYFSESQAKEIIDRLLDKLSSVSDMP